MQTIERFDGRAFPTTPGLARQWLRGRCRRSPTALETIYCAELVATTYQAMGLLPRSGRPTGTTRAASERRPPRLVEPFALEAEVAIRQAAQLESAQAPWPSASMSSAAGRGDHQREPDRATAPTSRHMSAATGTPVIPPNAA